LFNTIKKITMALFALAVITISTPAHPTEAAVTLTVDPSSGEVGDAVTIHGSGLYLGQSPVFRIYFSDQEIDLSGDDDKYVEDNLIRYSYFPVTNIVDDSFSQTINVPTSFNTGLINRDGTYYFYLAKLNGTINKYLIQQVVPFTIVGFTQVTLTPTQGNVGQELEIEGEGFWPGEDIQIIFNNIDITEDYLDGEPKAVASGAAAGTFNVVVPIPVSTYGEKEVKITGEDSGVEVTRTFTVRPKVTLSPVSGGTGTQVIVRGTGFSQSADVYFGSTFIVRAQATSGSFMEAVTVPAGTAPGNYIIKAEDAIRPTTINASASFEVVLLLNPSITLDPQGETVGSIVDISGVEFNNAKSITLTIDDEEVEPEGAITTTSAGTFDGSFAIPELPSGTHTVKASDGIVEATQTFTVTPEAALSKPSGRAGEQVAVNGTGFRANTAVTVTFAGTQVTLDAASPKTDASGSFSYSFTVPIVAEDTHDVVISVGSASVTRTFATDMDMTIAPSSGQAGTDIALTASGFAPSSPAVITFGNTNLTTTTTSAQGSLSVVFTVPAVAEGTYPVKVEVAGISASKDFTVSADVSFSPSSGPVGTQITVAGTGFGASKPLTLTWDGDNMEGAGTTTAEGAFNVVFSVPPVQAGNYTISISDGTVTKTHTFAVSASTPPIPQPLSPALKARLTGNPTFDWNPVTYDIMAVTYELQIARDAGFATLVLEKKNLATTEYTLAATEQLEKAGEENPYFWRVRAVDEAGNASGWTGAADFYYGSTWPAWLTWVLIGLGVVVLGVITFILGKRIAYYSY